jgi:hypothetical protein
MSSSPDTSSEDQKDLAQALHWLMPLHFFYEKRGLELPNFQFLNGRDVPYPYRSLLVHENDMTPTLAAFHHSKLYLEVLEKELNDDFLLRFVILRSEESDVPVEFGAIAIQLAGFDAEVRDAIVDCHIPLGHILADYDVEHQGSPAAYFSVPADEPIGEALAQPLSTMLHGRCNQLLDGEGHVFADIVEILPRSNESEKWIETVK